MKKALEKYTTEITTLSNIEVSFFSHQVKDTSSYQAFSQRSTVRDLHETSTNCWNKGQVGMLLETVMQMELLELFRSQI